MGCDIHPHIEYAEYENNDGAPIWWHFSDFFFLRDYGLFAQMAGVRDYNGVSPVVAPRGVPVDMSHETMSHFTLLISERYGDESGYATRADAVRWVSQGASTWVTAPDVEYPRITHPDWHTPSWLSTEEFAQAIERTEKQRGGKVRANAHAALAAMQAFENNGLKARIVFWFDN